MNRFKKIIWTCAVGLLTTPVFVFAQGTPGDRPGGSQSGGGRGKTEVLEGPIDADNVAEVLEKIIDALLIILTPIAIIMTIWAGFLFMTAGSNEEKVKTARHTLLYVVIGIAILILSRGAVSFVESILK